MKLFKTLIVVLTSLTCTLFVPPQAANANKDFTYFPISDTELRTGIGKSKDDVVGMVQLLRRADQHKKGDVAFDLLKRMRVREPNNAIVQAAYCFAFDYEYQESRGDTRVRVRTSAELEAFDVSLERAYKSSPRLWLTYVVDANRQLFKPPYLSTREKNDAFSLLQKAVKLAPRVSFTHYYLARANDLMGVRGDWRAYDEALDELKTSMSLQPALADAALTHLTICEIRVPNAKEAKWAARQLVKLLAVGTPLRVTTRKKLAKYGVVIPWKS